MKRSSLAITLAVAAFLLFAVAPTAHRAIASRVQRQ